MLATHFKIALIVLLALAALYQWLRADSAIGYADGLIDKLNIAKQEIKQLKSKVAQLEKQVDELRGLP